MTARKETYEAKGLYGKNVQLIAIQIQSIVAAAMQVNAGTAFHMPKTNKKPVECKDHSTGG